MGGGNRDGNGSEAEDPRLTAGKQGRAWSSAGPSRSQGAQPSVIVSVTSRARGLHWDPSLEGHSPGGGMGSESRVI